VSSGGNSRSSPSLLKRSYGLIFTPHALGRPPAVKIGEITAEAQREIGKSYHSAILGTATAIRDRGQAGFAIASAVAGGIATAGALTHIEKRPTSVQVFGVLALGAWLLAAWMYLQVVAGHVHLGYEPVKEGNEADAAKLALREALDTKWYLEWRLDIAILLTGAALLMSLVAVIIALAA
jgi:hypothetical protein